MSKHEDREMNAELEAERNRWLVPTPWKTNCSYAETLAIVEGPRGQHVTDYVHKINADRIVRAVNCHDDLLAACKAALDPDPCQLDHHGNCQAHSLGAPCEQKLLREAIAKAEARP